MALRRKTRPNRRTVRPALELLEERLAPTVSPVDLNDQSLWGNTGAKASSTPSISSDGQLVAFASDADNLVANDTNGLTDVFVYNRTTRQVSLVSVGVNGYAAGSDSNPVISPDGRYVIFSGGNSYLHQAVLPGVTGTQLFLRDLTTSTTTLLSINAAGTGGANGTPSFPIFSADSRHVAFLSNSTQLVAGITYSSYYGNDLFWRDLTTNTTKLVSVSLDGAHNGNADSGNFSREFGLSADGRFVTFRSSASNLVSLSNSGIEQIYVRDMKVGVTSMVSVEKTGLAGAAGHHDLNAGNFVISADGRFVLFNSGASNVVDVPVGGGKNSYLRDLQNGTTVLVSADMNGHGIGANGSEILSPDGHWSAFATAATGVTNLPTNNKTNVYVRNNLTGVISLASINRTGTGGGNDGSGLGLFYDFPGNLSFSPDGHYLAFRSLATDLTPSVTTTGNRNLYARDLLTNTTILLSANSSGTDGGNADSDTAVFSADGRFVAFKSTASNLTTGDFNKVADIFVRDISLKQTQASSLRSPQIPVELPAAAGATLNSVSGNGKYVVFTSNVFYGQGYSDLAPTVPFSSTFSQGHVFVRNIQTGSVQVVDRDSTGTAVGGFKGVITPDGRYVAFIGYTNLLPLTIGTFDPHDLILYVRDLQTNTLKVASVTPDGTHDIPLAGDSEIKISDDGRYVAFTSPYGGFPGVTNPSNKSAVYFRDLVSGNTYLVSHDTANDGQIRGRSVSISLSSDGRYVLFASDDANLAPGDTNSAIDVFQWDRTTQLVSLVSIDSNYSGVGNAQSSNGDRPVMTPDGRYVAFSSNASNLVVGDSNGFGDVFLRDMQAGITYLISLTNTGAGGNNASYYPTISADGNRVGFLSYASNMTTDPAAEGGIKTFVRDRNTNATIVATVNGSGSSVSGGGSLSPNGRYIFFGSDRDDLVPNFVDFNGGAQDLYLRDIDAGLTKLVTANFSGTTGANSETNSSSFTYLFAADSSAVYFDANASNLLATDRNNQQDIFTSPTSGYSTIRGQVYNDLNANGTKDGAEIGVPYWTVYLDSNNNNVLDTNEVRVITDASGNYAINGLTAGTYKVVVVNQQGWVTTQPAAPGTRSVTISPDGSITTGQDFGEVQPLPDLVTSAVSVTPNSGAPGQVVTVTWTVTNSGATAAVGGWQDAVYLSPTPTLGVDAQLLSTVAHTGGLSLGGHYSGSVQLALPGSEGDWYVIVRSDRRNQVSEGTFDANKANNVAATNAILHIGIPQLTIGTPAQDQLTATGPDRYFQVSGTQGKSLLLALSSSAATGQLELYVKRGGLPTAYDFDFASRTAGQPGQMVTIPQAQGGTYYILVHGVSGAAKTSMFTLTATQPGVTLQSIGLSSGGNSGRVTIPIFGTNIQAEAQVVLKMGATQITPVAVDYRSASELYATFDLNGKPTGAYDIQITQGLEVAGLSSVFSVVTGQAKPVVLTLSTPTAVRTNRPYGKVVITYENPGNVDMVAPLITLTADYAELRLSTQATTAGTSVQFLGISSDGPAGILRPGQRGEMTILFTTTPIIGAINFQTLIADDSIPMNWASFKDALRMDHIPVDAWDAIYGNFTSAVGSTVGAYHAVLANDASYLSHLGEYTSDVSRLLGFELNKAGNIFTSQTLATVTDISYPAPGLALSFVRQYQQSLAGRYTVGPFGRGWTTNWQISAETDAEGNVEIASNGASQFFARQADGTYQAPGGNTTILSLVNGHYQLRQSDGTQVVFNADGTLNYVQDANGNRITVGYTTGRLTSLTHSDGDAITIHYNAQGLIDQVTDPGARTTTYTYDPSGEHLIGYTDKYGSHTYTYLTGQANPALNHALTQIAYSDNTHVYYSYDNKGRLIESKRDNNQEEITYTYDSVGSYTITNAIGGQTTYLIDDFGQLGEVINPLGQRVQYTYDDQHHLIKTTVPLGTTYIYSYDSQGNLTSTTDPAGNQVNFTYDNAYHLTGFEDAKGNNTNYQVDASGNLRSITYADNSGQQFQYDPLGNLSETINARGQALTYTYYTNGLPKQKTYADNTTVNFVYDSHGNLTQVTDRADQVTNLHYDSADNLDQINYPDGKFLHFLYNIVGQRTQSIDQTGFTVNYVYDALGRLWKLLDVNNALIVEYTYDAAGRLIQKDLGNGTRTTYEYNPAGQLLHLINLAPDHTSINSRFDYSYDALGHAITVDNSDGHWDYTYDATGQLTHAIFTSNNTAVLPNQDLEYFYDAAGNRTQTIINGVTTNYTVNSLNEYTQVGDTVYTYDADGNLASTVTGGVNTTYTFDQENQLMGITDPAVSYSYQYDVFGNQVASTQNGVNESYVVDPLGMGARVATFDNNGTLVDHYIFGIGLVSTASGGNSGYYDFDMTGNTIGISGINGNYVNRYSYLPFGEKNVLTNTLTNAFTFIGQFGVTTNNTSLLQMRARDYDPGIGQFVSNDPIGLFGGDTNTRRYVRNNPVTLIDPTGLCFTPRADPPIYDPNNYDPKDSPDITPTWDDAPTVPYDPTDIFPQPLPENWIPYYYGPDGIYFYDPEYPGIYKNTPTTPGSSPNYGFAPNEGVGDPPNSSAGGGGGGCDCGCPLPPTPPPGGESGPGGRTPIRGPVDPNEIIGPSGIGVQNWITPNQSLPYTIKFENDPKKATVAAQDVFITTTLDSQLDWSTFQLGSFQFGSTTVEIPAGLQSYATSIMTSNIDGTPLRLDFSANLNQDTGLVTWIFRSIDPVTGDVPENPYAGFLPVNDSTHRGEGQVTYTIKPKPDLLTEAVISAIASIVFDTNEAIATNTVTNPIYNGPTLVFNDDLNRTNNTNLGNNWVEQVGNLTIVNNRLQSASTVALGSVVGINLADVRVQADVIASPTRAVGLLVRYSGVGDKNFYLGSILNSNGTFYADIWRNLNGAWKLLSRKAVASNIGTLAFEAVGTKLKLYFNGVLVNDVNDGSLTGSAGVGVRYSIQCTADNIRVEKLYAINQVLPVGDALHGSTGDQLDSTRWQELAGNFSIVNNQANGDAAVNVALVTGVNTTDSDQQLSFTLPATGNHSAALVARYGGGKLYLGIFSRSGSSTAVSVLSYVSGKWTTLATSPATGNTGTLRFVVYGTTLKLYLDGTLKVTANDSAVLTGGVGIRTTQGVRLANYQSSDFVPETVVPFTDSFTGSNGDPLQDAWRTAAGRFTLSNNKAVGSSPVNLATLSNVELTDSSTQVAVNYTGTGNYGVGLVARHSGPGDSNLYYAGLRINNGIATVDIWKNVNGLWTNLLSKRLTKRTGVLRFDVIGTSLKLFIDGVLIGSLTDTSLTSGSIGIRGSQGVSFDDFQMLT